MITATVRWIHSIQAFESSSAGISWPWQSGQSGQPSPESVARTMTPIVTSPRAVARVSAASFWKRFTRRVILPRRHVPTDLRYPVGDESPTPSPARCVARPVWSRPAARRPIARASPRRPRRGLRQRPDPARAAGWGPAGHDPDAHPDHGLERDHLRQGPDPVPLPRQREPGRQRPRPHGEGRVLRPRPRPEQGGRDRRRRVRLDDPGRARHVRRRRRPARGRAPGAPNSRPRRRLSRRDDPAHLLGPRRRPPSRSARRRRPRRRRPPPSVGGDLAKISTDAKPDPAFYQTSVADALAAQKPFILIFATPKFCTSQQCGPTLDHFKPIAAAHPDVTFINVEPYKLQVKDGSLQPVLDANNGLIATDISNAWGLLPSRGCSRSTGTGSSGVRT